MYHLVHVSMEVSQECRIPLEALKPKTKPFKASEFGPSRVALQHYTLYPDRQTRTWKGLWFRAWGF